MRTPAPLAILLSVSICLASACAGGDKSDEDDDGGGWSSDSGGGGVGGGVGGGSGSGDIDGDGYGADEDCDDTDASVNPGAEEIQGNGVDDDCDPDTCVSADFSSSRATWALPSRWQDGTGEEDWTTTGGSAYCYSGNATSSYALADLDGDGLSDLIETWHCGEDSVGDTEWWVYANTGSGFSTTRTSWALPSRWQEGTGEEDWTATSGSAYCYSGNATSSYALADLDGDGLSDLVETWHCGEDSVGDTEWWVYANTGSGFSTTRTSWALPSRWQEGTGEEDWTAIGSSAYCYSGNATSSYALIDLDSDGLSDLVETFHCEEDSVGKTEWWLYQNTGSGFSTTRTTWSMPSRWYDGSGEDHWTGTAGAAYCYTDNGASTFSVADLDGDGVLDLIETYHCGEDAVGDSEWWVYANTGSGFSTTRASWKLPTRWQDGSGEEDWTALAGGASCYTDNATSSYAVFDLDGDGLSELVETWHCDDDSVGDTEWWVYDNTGSGFSSTRTTWALPNRWQDGTGEEDWTTTGASAYCYSTNATSSYTIADLDGNGTLDLVETWHCGDDSVGNTEWWMYSGQCDE